MGVHARGWCLGPRVLSAGARSRGSSASARAWAGLTPELAEAAADRPLTPCRLRGRESAIEIHPTFQSGRVGARPGRIGLSPGYFRR
jgi:hypothetical protein